MPMVAMRGSCTSTPIRWERAPWPHPLTRTSSSTRVRAHPARKRHGIGAPAASGQDTLGFRTSRRWHSASLLMAVNCVCKRRRHAAGRARPTIRPSWTTRSLTTCECQRWIRQRATMHGHECFGLCRGLPPELRRPPGPLYCSNGTPQCQNTAHANSFQHAGIGAILNSNCAEFGPQAQPQPSLQAAEPCHLSSLHPNYDAAETAAAYEAVGLLDCEEPNCKLPDCELECAEAYLNPTAYQPVIRPAPHTLLTIRT